MCHQAGLSIYVIRLDSLHICHQAGLFNHVSSSWTLYSCFIRLDSLHMCHQAGLSTDVSSEKSFTVYSANEDIFVSGVSVH